MNNLKLAITLVLAVASTACATTQVADKLHQKNLMTALNEPPKTGIYMTVTGPGCLAVQDDLLVKFWEVPQYESYGYVPYSSDGTIITIVIDSRVNEEPERFHVKVRSVLKSGQGSGTPFMAGGGCERLREYLCSYYRSTYPNCE